MGELDDHGETIIDAMGEKRIIYYNPIINQVRIENPFVSQNDKKGDEDDEHRTTFTLLPVQNDAEVSDHI